MTCDDIFEGTVLTEPQMKEDLEILRGYCKSIGLETVPIPSSQETPIPSLAILLEDDERERIRMMTANFLPLDKKHAEFSKYLQFYLELQNDLKGVDRGELLELLTWLNARLSLGCCVLREAEGDRPVRVILRASQGFPLCEPVDIAAFTESMFLFDSSCDAVSGFLDLMAEGKSFAEIQALLEAES